MTGRPKVPFLGVRKGTGDLLQAQEGEHIDSHGPGLALQNHSQRSMGIGGVHKVSRVWQPRRLSVKSQRCSARKPFVTRHETGQQAVDVLGRHRAVEEEPPG